MVERLYSYFILISNKVHIYSGEGRKSGKRHPNSIVLKNIEHVMMIFINHARIYLGLRASPSVCLAPRLSQGMAGWPFFRQLRSVCSHSGPTCQ